MDLLYKIKNKKELGGIDDSFVIETLQYIQRKYPKAKEKELIKRTREILRRKIGSFNTDSISPAGSHLSVKERQRYYDEFKSKVYSLNPKSILDIGCGLNPLALAKPGVYYIATDINASNLNVIDEFFRKNKISGETLALDATKAVFPEADLALLLKVVDLLDKKGHKKTEEILKSLKSRNIIVSFSTKTLSGKPMNHPQRGWIERLLNRLEYRFSIWRTNNEIYYFIEKH